MTFHFFCFDSLLCALWYDYNDCHGVAIWCWDILYSFLFICSLKGTSSEWFQLHLDSTNNEHKILFLSCNKRRFNQIDNIFRIINVNATKREWRWIIIKTLRNEEEKIQFLTPNYFLACLSIDFSWYIFGSSLHYHFFLLNHKVNQVEFRVISSFFSFIVCHSLNVRTKMNEKIHT